MNIKGGQQKVHANKNAKKGTINEIFSSPR